MQIKSTDYTSKISIKMEENGNYEKIKRYWNNYPGKSQG